MLFKMSEDKNASTTDETTVPPTIVVEGISGSPDTHRSARRVSKKAVVITIVCVIGVGLLVTGALVGIRLYFDGKIEEQKYTIKVNGAIQNVSTLNNEVTYHVKRKDGVEMWVVQDFDKELQTIRYLSDHKVGCIVTALNRSISTMPDAVPSWTETASGDNSSSQPVTYKIVSEAINDHTFLGPKARELCENIPTYHAVRSCGNEQSTGSGISNRQKRDILIVEWEYEVIDVLFVFDNGGWIRITIESLKVSVTYIKE